MNDNEVNEMDINIDINSYKLSESVTQFMLKNSQIISKLEAMVSQITRHKSRCNVTKTVGTSVSGVGSVAMATGLVLTPLTAGISSLVLIGGGVATAVGTVTNIGTELADKWISRRFLNDIQVLAEQRNKCAFDLTLRFNEFNAVLTQNIKNKFNPHLKMNGDCEQAMDLINILKLMANGSVSLYKFGNNSLKLLDAFNEVNSLNALKAAKAVKTSSNLGTSLTKSAITLIPAETKGMSSLLRTTAPAVGKNVFKGVSAAAGLAFTVIDVVNLVQDWNRCHPTIDVINSLIEELKSDAKLVESIYSIITNDDCDQQLIDDIISLIQMNSINNFDNYLDNEPVVSINWNDCEASYSKSASQQL